MKKFVLLYMAAIFYAAGAAAQDARDFRKEYEDFRRSAFARYSSFRDSCNMAYARFMSESWEKFRVEAPMPAPRKPKPVVQPVYEPQAKPEPADVEGNPIPFEVVVAAAGTEPRPAPIEPIEESSGLGVLPLSFTFYNTTCSVNTDPFSKFTLRSTAESDVAAAWTDLAMRRLDPTVGGCLDLRDELALCDWAYVQMTGAFAENFLGAAKPNEAALLQAYILMQSGYKLRMSRCGERLVPLVCSDDSIYLRSYILIDGERYYVTGDEPVEGDIYIYNMAFHGERPMSMAIGELPRFRPLVTECRPFTSERYPSLNVPVCNDLTLVDFYSDYPRVRWNIYAAASLGPEVRAGVMPALRSFIEGKSPQQAANILINFVQTAFTYMYDDEQFGGDRPLFGDETFYYPGSDCEDRAILYSILVWELLGLDVVLLDYPDHIATAVCFGDVAYGDYLLYEGRKFTICDPTYIGAEIGECMPEYKRTPPEVVVIR